MNETSELEDTTTKHDMEENESTKTTVTIVQMKVRLRASQIRMIRMHALVLYFVLVQQTMICFQLPD